MGETERTSVAVLTSGRGMAAESFARAVRDQGELDFDIGLAICSTPPTESKIYGQLGALGIQSVVYIGGENYPRGAVERGQTLQESQAILDQVVAHGCGHVLLLGYSRLVQGELLRQRGWSGRYTSPFQAQMSSARLGPLISETRDSYGLETCKKVLKLQASQRIGPRADRSAVAPRYIMYLPGRGAGNGQVVGERQIEIDRRQETPESLRQKVMRMHATDLPGMLNSFLQQQIAYHAKQNLK